jgi:hypothetical protein
MKTTRRETLIAAAFVGVAFTNALPAQAQR